MWVDQAAIAVASYLPQSLKSAARQLLFKNRHPNHLALRGVGAVQDLYYWVCEAGLDTLVPIENYFSVFFPKLDTATTVTITIFDHLGKEIGRKTLSVPHLGCEKVRLSSLLREFTSGARLQARFGTLLCNLVVPRSVQSLLAGAGPFYFWDRFYIAYLNREGQPTFVHGVDKTMICPAQEAKESFWYAPVKKYQWAPEIPINIGDYSRFSVVMLNRVSRSGKMRLILEDSNDNRREWEATIEPMGVHRFELTTENTTGLDPVELRMRIEGMTSQWGRPLVFKEFTSGVISVMHC